MQQEFTDYVEEKVKNTIREHKLINKKDKVLVAVSGGKDSTTALYTLHKLGYDTEAILIDQLLGEYSKKNQQNIQEFCQQKNIKLHTIHMRDEYGCSVCYMKDVLDKKGIKLNTCTICGVIRRSILNKWAKKLKADKIATGHNLDDEAQTYLMNFLQGNIERSARLGPQSGIRPDPLFVQRIKPLYFITEEETEKYSRQMGFPVVYDPCPCSVDSFRTHVKKILNELQKTNPKAKENIVRSFLKITPELTKAHDKNKIRACELCGEPSSQDICRKCKIITHLTNKK